MYCRERVGTPATGLGPRCCVRRARLTIRLERDREFADSSLEETRFEPSVPPLQALPTGCLAEADESEIVQPIAHLFGGFDNHGERDIRSGIEVEHEPARHLRPFRLAIPGVEFQRGNLGDCPEPELPPAPKKPPEAMF
jgi:hypothetical protein